MWRHLLLMTFLLFLEACNRNHRYQESYRPWEKTLFPPEHTIPLREEKVDIPEPTKEILTRGRQLFERDCIACHGIGGNGRGIVTFKGFNPPPSFHTEYLVKRGPDHIVETITKGRGRMPSYQRRLTMKERWMVAHYVKALQLSKHFPVEKLSDDDKRRIK